MKIVIVYLIVIFIIGKFLSFTTENNVDDGIGAVE